MSQPTESARPGLMLHAPNGEPLPLAYRWLRAHGLAALRPWYFIDDPAEAQRLRGESVIEVAPPNESLVRDLAPFAQRRDRDEVAGFWECAREALLGDAREWANEEGLARLLAARK